MTARAYRDSSENYHARPGFVHASNLKQFLDSPLDWKRRFVDGTLPKEPPTPAMRFGTLVHSLVLEPETVDREFVCIPPAIARRMSNRVLEDWRAECANGREVIMPDVWREAKALADALRQHPETRPWLDAPGEVELSLDWKECGLNMTARLDKFFLREPLNLVCDVKTTAWLEGFESSIFKWGYDLQSAQYSAALEAWTGRQSEVRFLVVDKRHRDCAVVTVTEDQQAAANAKRRKILEKIKECFDSGVWPSKQIDSPANTNTSTEVESWELAFSESL